MAKITSEEQIELIQSKGYWQVWLRPLASLQDKLSIEKCHEIVENSKVSLRGWDFPHINRNVGFTNNYQEYIESYCSFMALNEYWRFYRDGQFIHFFGIESDWYDQAEVRTKLSQSEKGFEVIAGLYRFTEIFELASRLARKGNYTSGIDLEVKLFGTQNRQLFMWDIGRNFHANYICKQEPLIVTQQISLEDITTKSAELALNAYLDILPAFQWTKPSRDVLAEDQRKFLERRI